MPVKVWERMSNTGVSLVAANILARICTAGANISAKAPGWAQGSKNQNATVKGQMKQSGKEVKNAGQGLGENVKHGRVARGGKHIGTHMYRGGKHFGKGSGMAVKKTGKAVKNAAKPD